MSDPTRDPNGGSDDEGRAGSASSETPDPYARTVFMPLRDQGSDRPSPRGTGALGERDDAEAEPASGGGGASGAGRDPGDAKDALRDASEILTFLQAAETMHRAVDGDSGSTGSPGPLVARQLSVIEFLRGVTERGSTAAASIDRDEEEQPREADRSPTPAANPGFASPAVGGSGTIASRGSSSSDVGSGGGTGFGSGAGGGREPAAGLGTGSGSASSPAPTPGFQVQPSQGQPFGSPSGYQPTPVAGGSWQGGAAAGGAASGGATGGGTSGSPVGGQPVGGQQWGGYARAGGAQGGQPQTAAPQPSFPGATHRVPAGGMPAWAAPDPSRPPVVNLAANLDLRVAERAGDWARVVASNGWSGWVDARRLLPFQ